MKCEVIVCLSDAFQRIGRHHATIELTARAFGSDRRLRYFRLHELSPTYGTRYPSGINLLITEASEYRDLSRIDYRDVVINRARYLTIIITGGADRSSSKHDDAIDYLSPRNNRVSVKREIDSSRLDLSARKRKRNKKRAREKKETTKKRTDARARTSCLRFIFERNDGIHDATSEIR